MREYGQGAWEGVEALREAVDEIGAARVIPYVQKAIASTVRVILRADDSNGTIGDLIRSLLEMHAHLCAAEPPPTAKLVPWLVKFQFDGTQDFFDIDIVDYAESLGERGMARYRSELARITEALSPEPSEDEERALREAQYRDHEPYERMVNDRHARFLLDYNTKRLAVVDRDIDAIVAVYGGDQSRAYRLHDVAKALVEIGEVDRAIGFAERAALSERSFQAEKAAHYWCELLALHRPAEEFAARNSVFEHWPSSSNASGLRDAAAGEWEWEWEWEWAGIQERVLTVLAARPYDYIVFLLLTLSDVPRAWAEALRLDLDSDDLWIRLVDAYQQLDLAAVVSVLCRLIESDLRVADVGNYRSAVKRLRQLRTISAGVGQTDDARAYTAQLREQHRNRPRFLQELDRAKFL